MSIAREAFPFVLPIAAVGLLLGAAVHPLAALPFALGVSFVLWFFRDPERRTPEDPDALISPADGKVIQAGPRMISIFMNVFDVHVCRAPTSGEIEDVRHVPGSFVAAFRDDASTANERTHIVLREETRRLRFTLVAGLIARRIVCKVATGERVTAGQRIGLIRFGSRVDVELPSGCRTLVRIGQRTRAGETILARRDPGS
jgi:phosphatidylserine decarboxylase